MIQTLITTSLFQCLVLGKLLTEQTVLMTIYSCAEKSHFKMFCRHTIAMPLSIYKFLFVGLAPPGYKLVSVHIISRHGTRALMNTSLSLGPLKYP